MLFTTRFRLVAFCILSIIAVLLCRMWIGAQRESQRGIQAWQSGDHQRAILHFRRTMAYYFPANPRVTRAAQQLKRIAEEAERSNKNDVALHAWRNLRGAILSIRWAYQPLSQMLPEANQHIVTLSAKHPEAARVLKTSRGMRALHHRLANPPEPHRGWTAIALFGFLLWVIGTFRLILMPPPANNRSGVKRNLRFIWQRRLPLATAVITGWLLFCLGLWRA